MSRPKFIQELLISLFIWSGTKLYNVVSLYCPDGDGEDEKIYAVHFAYDENVLVQSAQATVEENKSVEVITNKDKNE